MLHREAVEPRLFDLAQRLSNHPALSRFYFGGTSLALQFGHRFSIEIDLFTHEDFDFREVTEALEGFEDCSIQTSKDGTAIAEIEGVKIDIIRHLYPLVGEIIESDSLRLLGPSDIAAMKILAISSRGSKKDFIDIHALLEKFSLSELLEFFSAKYPKMEVFQAVMSLNYFEDAESEPMPKMLEAISWARIKKRLREAVAAL